MQLVSVDTPEGDDAVDPATLSRARAQLNTRTDYQSRFFTHKGNVIADRLFTTLVLPRTRWYCVEGVRSSLMLFSL